MRASPGSARRSSAGRSATGAPSATPPALARSAALRPPHAQHPLDLLEEHVRLQVHAVARLPLTERALGEGVRDQGHGEARTATGEDRQADAVDGDRALLDQVGGEGAGGAEAVEEPVAVARDPLQAPDAVDVALDDVAAHAVAHAERALEVDARPGGQAAKRGAAERLGRRLDREAPVAPRRDGEAGAVHGDALAEPEAREGPRRRYGEARPAVARPAPLDAAGRLDDAGEQLSRRPLAGRALVGRLAASLDRHQARAAGRAALGPLLAEPLQPLLVVLREVAVLIGFLLLVELLAQAILLVIGHRPSPCRGGTPRAGDRAAAAPTRTRCSAP